PNVVLEYCPNQGGMFHLQGKTGEGFGQYVVGVFAKAAPPKPVAAPGPTMESLCDGQAAGAAPGATRSGPLLPGSNEKTDWSVMPTPGMCYWLIACGDPGHVNGISSFLWGPDNKRITETKSPTGTAMIGHCPTVAGMFKVQGKVTKGKGNFGLGVYSKKMN